MQSEDLDPGSANYGPKAKLSPLPIFLNKVLLTLRHAHQFTHYTWLPSWYNGKIVMTEQRTHPSSISHARLQPSSPSKDPKCSWPHPATPGLHHHLAKAQEYIPGSRPAGPPLKGWWLGNHPLFDPQYGLLYPPQTPPQIFTLVKSG